jgi:hypothetical protein
MLEAFGYDPQGESLHPSLRFILRRAVGEYSRQVGDLGDPATVVLSLEFHLERHAASVAIAILAAFPALREVRRTPGISCKGRGSPAGADLVSFIPLFCGITFLRGRQSGLEQLRCAAYEFRALAPEQALFGRQSCPLRRTDVAAK